MPSVHRKFFTVCATVVAAAPLCAFAESIVIGEGRVKTDVGELVTSAGRSWACLDAEWRTVGAGPGGSGTQYSCAGTLLDSGTYTAVSAGRTAVALADVNAVLDRVAVDVARNAESTEALRVWIEAQARSSSKLLYETIAARFDAIPARVLANKGVRDAIAKLREDVLAAVQATGASSPNGR
jgi:hypothetical protein